jgi:hypothetical protein
MEFARRTQSPGVSLTVSNQFRIFSVVFSIEGWVVCVEHKDILLAAWDKEQEILKEKEKEVQKDR